VPPAPNPAPAAQTAPRSVTTTTVTPTVTAAVQPPPTASPPAAAPRQGTAAEPPRQLRLVEEDPATAALRQRATTPGAHPSWYLEDDPHYDTAAAAAPGPAEAKPTIAAGGKRMVVTSDVDVRSGPDPASPSLGVLRAGALIAVGDCNRWCAVTVDDKTGWVFSAFLAEASAVTAAR
jgi:hypothetical protein